MLENEDKMIVEEEQKTGGVGRLIIGGALLAIGIGLVVKKVRSHIKNKKAVNKDEPIVLDEDEFDIHEDLPEVDDFGNGTDNK